MGATTTTGTGLGESFGEHKPENSNGCCGGRQPETEATPVIRRQCAARIKTGSVVRHKTSTGTRIRTC